MDLKPIVLESKAQSEVKIGLENKLQKNKYQLRSRFTAGAKLNRIVH